MKATFRSLTPTRAEFVLEEVDHAFANALRRTLVADVPKLAIDEVTIYDNTSALFDEMLAHRLGLLPVPTDPDAFNFRDQCTCNGEGCPSCTVLFTLSKEGPATVYSGDLTPADPRFAVPDARIPIVKLLEGQRVMLEAAAILGRTTQHAKWQAVVGCGYSEYPSIKVPDTPLSASVQEALEPVLPEGVVSLENGRLRVHDDEKAFLWVRSVQKLYGIDGLEATLDPKRFVFRVETEGSLSAKVAIQQACKLLMTKLKDVEQQAPDLELAAPPA
ncbi:MAG TPA: DNA-directed RNA polymerase subunit D [Candidatus Thermoplasmatota archaeon]|nr:DNA-directed RNA polymerase subunit D [Candidatus Thermoplasmatota archaeon]